MADLFNRGAFSVWGKGRGNPLKETYRLKEAAEAAFRRSGFDASKRPGLALQKVQQLCDEFRVELPTELIITLAIAVDDLFEEACIFLPEIDLEEVDVPGEQGRTVRGRYSEQLRFFQAPSKSLNLFDLVVSASLSHVVGRLALVPAFQFVSANTIDRSDGLSLRLINYLEAPDEAIEGAFRAFFTEEVALHGMFTELRAQLESNVAIASGARPGRPISKDKLRLPTELEFSDPSEAADAYLRGTPLSDVFEAKLPLVIPDAARFEHTHIVAGSGHGKTQLISSLILEDLRRAQSEPRTIIVMDSQGDLISQIEKLALIQHTDLGDKLVILDPTEFHHPIALNPFSLDEERLSKLTPADRERTIFGAVDLFEHFFSELLGSELTSQQGTVFKFLIRLLIEIPGANLITLRDLMDDPKPFIPHMKRLTGSARAFFEREFLTGGYNQARKQIARRLWAILANPVFERIFSSPVNKVDWFSLMQDGRIILINTSKDYLKQDGSQLFGRFITAQIAQGIIERAKVPDAERVPTMIYIDEAHDYVDSTIKLLLSRGRKYRAGLTLAHQHLDQLSTSQRASLLANTSVKLVGGVSRKDSQVFAGEMRCSAEYLNALRKRGAETEFALAVRHIIGSAAKLSVPLGVLSRQERGLDDIIAMRREFITRVVGRRWEPEAPITPPPLEPETPPQITESAADLPGRGSASHRAEQARIRQLAMALGYAARVEERLEHGLGAVDVWVSNTKTEIAFEISVTTSAEHEVDNISKCLSSSFDYVVSTCADRDRLREIEALAWKTLPAREFPRVLFLLPEDIEPFLTTHQREPEQNVVMGYTVTIKKVPTSSDEKRIRREQLQRLVEREIA